MTQQPFLVSAKELAKLLGISTRTIWRRLQTGELVAPVRIGHMTRWRLDEVKAWIANGCPPQEPARDGGR